MTVWLVLALSVATNVYLLAALLRLERRYGDEDGT